MTANNDGIGDLPVGPETHYLQDLGVKCLWRLPLFLRPERRRLRYIRYQNFIQSRYPELQDLLAAAHERDLQVMIELEGIHTSDQAPGFRGPAGAAKRVAGTDYYVERRSEVQRVRSFYDHRKVEWTWESRDQRYFMARSFASAGLEHGQPQRCREMIGVVRYGLDMVGDACAVDCHFRICSFWSGRRYKTAKTFRTTC